MMQSVSRLSYIVLLVSVAWLGCKPGNQPKSIEVHDPATQKLTETYEELNGLKHGVRKLYDTSGKIIAIEHYRQGLFDGPYESYYPGGQSKEKGQYQNDQMTGTWQYFFENGKTKEELTFANGVEEGPAKEFYDNGQLSASGQYKAGMEDGLWKFFFTNGNLQQESNFTSGNKEGLQTFYDSATGKVIKKEEYKNGRPARYEQHNNPQN